MRFACLLCLALAGCGGPDAPEAPLGTFVLDRPAMAAALEAQGIPAATARRHAGALAVRLVFEEDGRFRLEQALGEAKPRVRQGSWSRDGDRIALFTEQIGVRPIEPPAVVEATLSQDRLVFEAQLPAPEDGNDEGDAPLPAFVLVRR